MCSLSEAPPDFRFTKKLPKQVKAFVGEDLTCQCTLNNHKAPVKWFKGDEEIVQDFSKYEIDKDIIGNCKLTVKNAAKDDIGKYYCKIVAPRVTGKDTKTKTEFVIKGRLKMDNYTIFLFY